MKACARSIGGAVYVEFLIAFLPLLIFFMCLWQMSRLYTTGLDVQHAAVLAARSGAVVLADDPARYGGEAVGQLTSQRKSAIESAALIPLAPFILDGSVIGVNVTFPSAPGSQSERTSYNPSNASDNVSDNQRVDFVIVRLDVTYRCRIPLADRIACDPVTRTRTISREAAYPYQGASFTY